MVYRSAALPAKYQYAGASITGRSRGTNEDAWAALPALGVFLVTDGCGGPDAGRVAADVTLASVARAVACGNADPLATAIREAHEALILAVDRGMGATVATLQLAAPWVVTASVGDCRVYRLRPNGSTGRSDGPKSALTLLTDATSQPGIEAQMLGDGSAPVVGVRRTALHPGDLYLLCSDGLTNQLDPGAIGAIVSEERLSLAGRCEQLLRAADEGVGEDNVTVLLVRPGHEPVRPGAR
ncbi:MAG: SpoIIE family protein phosphatase [Deltaproteobacteria bacterium]|nr:SpoIIE family protein phosphatase [Deltaproteobacteria bacterium]